MFRCYMYKPCDVVAYLPNVSALTHNIRSGLTNKRSDTRFYTKLDSARDRSKGPQVVGQRLFGVQKKSLNLNKKVHRKRGFG